ncbi:MAG: hypothetical protein WCO56_28075 [Verrucomicrobiota bacterium]
MHKFSWKVSTTMIEYTFKMDDGTVFRFEVDVDRGSAVPVAPKEPAFWTVLGFKQCENCPLNPSQQMYCPAAVDVERIADKFKHLLSYEQVTVEVTTPDRTYLKQCDVQTGLRALLGLVMATSSCPILSGLKGMAYFHLPFATTQETLYRAVSAYLLQQYFMYRDNLKPDWDLAGLAKLYAELQSVNRCFKGRLDAASVKDANMQAVGSMIYLSMSVALSVEDKLRDLRPRFAKSTPPA